MKIVITVFLAVFLFIISTRLGTLIDTFIKGKQVITVEKEVIIKVPTGWDGLSSGDLIQYSGVRLCVSSIRQWNLKMDSGEPNLEIAFRLPGQCQ